MTLKHTEKGNELSSEDWILRDRIVEVPHNCAYPTCPGAINKRKLEAFEKLKDIVFSGEYQSEYGRLASMALIIEEAEGRK